jgi:hypothetical protein
MEIYLAIIETYLCFTFTIAIIFLISINNKTNKTWNEIKKDNEEWKAEVRLKLSIIEKKLSWDDFWKKAKFNKDLFTNK